MAVNLPGQYATYRRLTERICHLSHIWRDRRWLCDHGKGTASASICTLKRVLRQNLAHVEPIHQPVKMLYDYDKINHQKF